MNEEEMMRQAFIAGMTAYQEFFFGQPYVEPEDLFQKWLYGSLGT